MEFKKKYDFATFYYESDKAVAHNWISWVFFNPFQFAKHDRKDKSLYLYKINNLLQK